MTSNPAAPPSADTGDTLFEPGQDQIGQNIEAILEFYTREEQKISHSQRMLERISSFVGQPVFLGVFLSHSGSLAYKQADEIASICARKITPVTVIA